ncbi:calexcitin-2-like [Hyposmocoma kahamanoa]|uniref:calexcitin-2-like n=1 Tax=Hyposmocoma kahamanoa TaxID=1477025 RepID=UPI000E6D78C6|nr:calexcitin-2-like [Hyposmocoma kahamanoa]
MVSDFRTKKYLHVFNTFIDVNKNGTIDKNDFLVTMRNVAKKRGYNPGDIIYKFMEDMLDLVWDGLIKAADADSDGTINKDEWIKLWDEYSKKAEKADEWYQLYAKCIFQLIDAGSDGSIDDQEFADFFENFGISKDKSLESFKKAAGGKNKVNWEEYFTLFKEYFTSDDVNAPGSCVFGQIN